MFCPNCGVENRNNAVFCKECGTKLILDSIEDTAQIETIKEPISVDSIQTIIEKKPKKKMKATHKVLFGVALAVLVAVGGFCGWYFTRPKKITLIAEDADASKYVTVTGVNGKAEATVADDALNDIVDTIEEGVGFTKEEAADAVITNKSDENSEKKITFNNLIQSLNIEIADAENLKNDDTVEVTVNYDKQYLDKLNIELDGTTFTYKVSGLKEVELLDLFKDVTVEWKKTSTTWSTYYELAVKNSTDNEVLKNFDYTVSSPKNGMATVSCYVDESELNNLGYGIDTSDDSVEYGDGCYQKTYMVGSEPDTDTTEAIGKITINVNKLNVRSDHSKSASKNGSRLNTGDVKEVYEIYNGSTYTWYRIGVNQWVAGKDNWVTYEQY